MRIFDQNADAYDAIRAKVAYPEGLYSTLAALCSRKDAALDIGCGNGVSTIRLAPYFAHVQGVDLGESLIEKARANYPEVLFSVGPAETLTVDRELDLVTCATAFYWMDRDLVLTRLADILGPAGIFCAYKYDFPVVYGKLRDVIERELVLKWSKYRDARLIEYDDTLERMQRSPTFESAERRLIPSIVELSAAEVALFFLSTSYVRRYMAETGSFDYASELTALCERVGEGNRIKVNFDLQAFIARR